jgi:hypothetical protein
MVSLRRAGTIRGQCQAKLLLGITEILTMALKANPDILECLYSPMVEKVTPLGEETFGPAPTVSVGDDFPNLQRLRHVAVQED